MVAFTFTDKTEICLVKGKHLQELYPLYRGCGTHYSAGDPVMDICKPVSVKCSSSGYRDWLGIVEFVLERVLFKKEVIKFTLLYLSRSLLTEHASYLCPFPLSAVLHDRDFRLQLRDWGYPLLQPIQKRSLHCFLW